MVTFSLHLETYLKIKLVNLREYLLLSLQETVFLYRIILDGPSWVSEFYALFISGF